jgi:hypothetical protein
MTKNYIESSATCLECLDNHRPIDDIKKSCIDVENLKIDANQEDKREYKSITLENYLAL